MTGNNEWSNIQLLGATSQWAAGSRVRVCWMLDGVVSVSLMSLTVYEFIYLSYMSYLTSSYAAHMCGYRFILSVPHINQARVILEF